MVDYITSSFAKFTLLIRDLLLELSAASSSNETLQQAQDAINQFQENQWKIKGKGVANIIGDAASKINQYNTILRPAILAPTSQFSPFPPSVVWGVFSMFLNSLHAVAGPR